MTSTTYSHPFHSRVAFLSFLAWLIATTISAPGQGVASRGVKPSPRGNPSGLPFHARFTDIAKEAGLLAPVIFGGVDRKQYILETIGCGAAFIDYNNDGWQDIFLLSGSRLKDTPPTQNATNRLYKNNADGTFTDVTEKAGLIRSGWASAITVGDFDNDGYEDLFVTSWGQNALYRNNGSGMFTDVTARAGLIHSGIKWGSGCTFVDYNRDGFLDLFVSNYLDFDFDRVPKPGANANCLWKGVPVNCGPRGLAPSAPVLYRNNKDKTFTDVSVASGVARAKGSYGMTAVAADFDGDGWPDIFVACDSSPSFLFRNNRDNTFSEIGLESGVAVNEDGMTQAGMGVGVGDYNLDGKLDIFKTHFSDDTNVLYRNNGKLNFEDVTLRARLGVETRFVGWGAGMFDFDNDGLPDIFMVTGHVYPEIESKYPNYAFRTPRLMFRNLGDGTFEELIEQAGSGISAAHVSRGCAFGDFDNDGDVDVLVINLNEAPSLLRNDVTVSNHWIKVKLKGVQSNSSAIGAKVIARYGGRQQAQEVHSQSSFYSANELRLHFGLGSSARVDLEISWPHGSQEIIKNISANQLITIKEGAGIVK